MSHWTALTVFPHLLLASNKTPTWGERKEKEKKESQEVSSLPGLNPAYSGCLLWSRADDPKLCCAGYFITVQWRYRGRQRPPSRHERHLGVLVWATLTRSYRSQWWANAGLGLQSALHPGVCPLTSCKSLCSRQLWRPYLQVCCLFCRGVRVGSSHQGHLGPWGTLSSKLPLSLCVLSCAQTSVWHSSWKKCKRDVMIQAEEIISDELIQQWVIMWFKG